MDEGPEEPLPAKPQAQAAVDYKKFNKSPRYVIDLEDESEDEDAKELLRLEDEVTPPPKQRK